jgi:hypothetical protein
MLKLKYRYSKLTLFKVLILNCKSDEKLEVISEVSGIIVYELFGFTRLQSTSE